MTRKLLTYLLVLIFLSVGIANAGLRDRSSRISLYGENKLPGHYIWSGAEITAPSGTPTANTWWLYFTSSGLTMEDDAGTQTVLSPSSTAWDDITAPDANDSISFSTYTMTLTGAATAADQFNITGTGAFGDVSVMKVSQATGDPTDGTVLEVVAADANVDPLVVSASGKANALVVGQNTGVVTIAGVAEGTDTLILTAGDLKLTDGDIDISGGDIVAGEDLEIAGDIIGGTGDINYTNFDVTGSTGDVVAGGDLTAVDGTFSGNVSVTGTFQQDAITAATAATTLTVDGTGAGGVTIGGTSTGAVTLGGGATQVTLPSTVDLVLSGGDITATDTANSDMVTFTNNTMTTADLLTLSATGTRTSNYVIAITDGATTTDTIGVTANALTSGTILYLDSDRFEAGSPAGFYIECYDGDSTDFSVGDEGKTVIDGVASTDVLTITAGDFQMTTGDIDVDDGFISVDNDADEASNITRDVAGGTNPTLTVKSDNTGATDVTLLVENDGTGNSTALQISHDGDYPVIDIDAGAARTGDVIDILMTNMLAERAMNVTGAITSAAGEGVIEVHATGNIASTGTLLRLDADTGTPAGTQGFMIYVDDDSGAQAGAYAVEIDSANNEGLKVAVGQSTFAELTNHTGGVNIDEDVDIDFDASDEEVTIVNTAEYGADGAQVTIENTDADVTANAYLLRLRYTDDGQSNADFIVCEDNNGDDQLAINALGDVIMGGASGTGGKFVSSFEDLTVESGGTAASVVVLTTFVTTNGDADEDAITLANGTVGQIKIFVSDVEGAGGDSYKITPATANGWTKITFDGAVGDGCTLMYTSNGWVIISNNGGTIT